MFERNEKREDKTRNERTNEKQETRGHPETRGQTCYWPQETRNEKREDTQKREDKHVTGLNIYISKIKVM